MPPRSPRTTPSATVTSGRPTSSTRPTAARSTFVSTAIREGADGYVITGDLTINGITKPVDLAAEFLGVAVGRVRARPARCRGHTSINRKDFNVTFNVPLDGGKLLIGDKVEITLADRGRQGLTAKVSREGLTAKVGREGLTAIA